MNKQVIGLQRGETAVEHRKVTFPRSIALTVLLFNILLVFLPAGSFFFLDTHEKLLLRSLEHALVQQARIFAGALSAALTAAKSAQTAPGTRLQKPASDSVLLGTEAEAIIKALRQRLDGRLRVFDADTMLLVDSAQYGNSEWADIDTTRSDPGDSSDSSDTGGTNALAQESLLYQIGSLPTRVARTVFGAPDAPVSAPDIFQGSGPFKDAAELQAALAGRYGATTRIIGSPDPAVILYSAIPVYAGNPDHISGGASAQSKPVGVVLASQSTYRILRDLYVLRLDMFRVVIASFFVALAVSLVLSLILIRPLRVLSRQAAEALDHRGRIRAGFKAFKGRNEIAVLSQGLADLGTRLEKQMRFVEGFSQDLVHEIRNPIASLRASLELLSTTVDSVGGPADDSRGNVNVSPEKGNAADISRFIAQMNQDLSRMNALVGGIREIGKIDVEDPGEDRVGLDLGTAVENCIERYRTMYPQLHFEFERIPTAGPRKNEGSKSANRTERPVAFLNPNRFSQVLDNIVDNAASFAPDGSVIDIGLEKKGKFAEISVRDRGPGFSQADAQRLFDRFYSTRKAALDGHHTGLGLAIAKSIAQNWGGDIKALQANPGAIFVVSVPLNNSLFDNIKLLWISVGPLDFTQ